MARVICFDIDGFLTEDTGMHRGDLSGSYIYRKPRVRAKEVMNKAYESGWYVLIFTGRREQQRRITEDWLHANGYNYHHLQMGKPYFTHVLDDRNLGASVEEQLDAFEEILDREEPGA